MKEVAALAGVSVATVSRALAGSPLVTAETRAAVENAVRQAGYTLNQAGRGLRLQVSHRILILLPTLSNPFFAEIVQGLDEKAQKSGFSVLVGSTEGSLEREDRLARQLLSGAADGLVLLTGRMVFPLYIWRTAFSNLHFGEASALAVIAIIISGLLGVALLYFVRSRPSR